MKIFLGIVIGVFITLVSLFIYHTYIVNKNTECINSISDKITKINSTDFIKVKELTDVEKFNSLNKRIDDFCIFGGVIITLLLAINVGVWIQADTIVRKHLHENFGKHKKQIINEVNEAQRLVGEINTQLEFTLKLRERYNIANEIRAIENDNQQPPA